MLRALIGFGVLVGIFFGRQAKWLNLTLFSLSRLKDGFHSISNSIQTWERDCVLEAVIAL